LDQRHSHVHFQRINEGFKTFAQTDVLLCDSSSLIIEYLMTRKPVVTLRNTHPGPYLLNVQTTEEIGPALQQALQHPTELMQAIEDYTAYHEVHRDGKNSARVLDAIDDYIANYQQKMRRKPLNIWRKLQMIKRYLRSKI
jgi:UDP-N-acetylglucosamine 2-epimerase